MFQTSVEVVWSSREKQRCDLHGCVGQCPRRTRWQRPGLGKASNDNQIQPVLVSDMLQRTCRSRTRSAPSATSVTPREGPKIMKASVGALDVPGRSTYAGRRRRAASASVRACVTRSVRLERLHPEPRPRRSSPICPGQDRAVRGVPRHPETFGDPDDGQMLAHDALQRPPQTASGELRPRLGRAAGVLAPHVPALAAPVAADRRPFSYADRLGWGTPAVRANCDWLRPTAQRSTRMSTASV